MDGTIKRAKMSTVRRTHLMKRNRNREKKHTHKNTAFNFVFSRETRLMQIDSLQTLFLCESFQRADTVI